MNNTADTDFIDITNEAGRQYQYSDGTEIKIKYPEKLTITEDGDHQVIDLEGTEYLVPFGWVSLKKAEKGRGVVKFFS